jgi:hypothetical protein
MDSQQSDLFPALPSGRWLHIARFAPRRSQ